MAIRFHFHAKLALTGRRALKQFILKIFEREKKEVKNLDYIFCDDSYLLDINRKFLQHNFYTDIITFDMSEQGMPITGEIYISIDMVKTNSRKFKSEFNEELYRVIFHGVLHLCGYKDKTKVDRSQMRYKEEFYLRMFHVKQ